MTSVTPKIFPPGDDFRRAIGDRPANLRFIDIDLSVARDQQRIPIAGSFLLCDLVAFDDKAVKSATLSTGHLFVRLGRSITDYIYMEAGRAWVGSPNDPFDEIYVTNPAQAGAMLRLYYSSGPITFPYQSQVNVAGAVSVTNFDSVIDLTGTTVAGAQLSALGTTTLVAAAANVNGLKIHRLSLSGQSTSRACIQARAIVSANIEDGAIAMINDQNQAHANGIIVPAGLGIFLVSEASFAWATIWYELL